MQTRLDMFKSVKSEDFESTLKRSFDQISSLYWFIHEYDFKTIENNGSTEFSIKFKSKKDCKTAYDSIPGFIQMYDRNFNIQKSMEKNYIYINMDELIV